MPSWLSIVALLFAGCVAPAAPRAARPVARDDGAELASLLPRRADRCVVVRPGRVPARRRSLLFRQSWAAPDVWDADLGVIAYARAEATLADGRRALRSYFRFGGDPDRLRSRARALGVRWASERCQGITCRRPVARWVDERTLEVARHPWPRRRLAIATHACLELARSEEAVEIGVRAGSPLTLDSHVGLRLERTLVATARGLEIRVVVPFRNVEDAERGAVEIREATPIWESLQPLSPRERVVTRRGVSVHASQRHTWTDLEMVAADERLRIAAAAQLRRRAEPLALEQIDVRRLAVVRHQARLRRAELERRSGPVRRQLAEGLASLLERAHAAHPSELWIAERLARLELDELGRPDRVVALVEGVLASGMSTDPRPWQALRREALASRSAEVLAAALVEDGIVAEAGDAQRAAEDLIRLRADGVAYEWAEGAWSLSRALRAPTPMVSAGGVLSRAGVLAALLALARLAEPDAGSTVQMAIRTTDELAPHAVGVFGPELIVVRGPASGSVLVAALSTSSLVQMRRLSVRVDSILGTGPASIVVQLRHPSGAPGRRVQLDGVLQMDAFEVRRVSRELAHINFDDVQRYLAQPLAELSPSLFPAPELTVRAQSPEEAARMGGVSSARGQVRCEAAGPMLRCGAPGRSEALGELLLDLARPRVRGLLQPAP